MYLVAFRVFQAEGTMVHSRDVAEEMKSSNSQPLLNTPGSSASKVLLFISKRLDC